MDLSEEYTVTLPRPESPALNQFIDNCHAMNLGSVDIPANSSISRSHTPEKAMNILPNNSLLLHHTHSHNNHPRVQEDTFVGQCTPDLFTDEDTKQMAFSPIHNIRDVSEHFNSGHDKAFLIPMNTTNTPIEPAAHFLRLRTQPYISSPLPCGGMAKSQCSSVLAEDPTFNSWVSLSSNSDEEGHQSLLKPANEFRVPNTVYNSHLHSNLFSRAPCDMEHDKVDSPLSNGCSKTNANHIFENAANQCLRPPVQKAHSPHGIRNDASNNGLDDLPHFSGGQKLSGESMSFDELLGQVCQLLNFGSNTSNDSTGAIKQVGLTDSFDNNTQDLRNHESNDLANFLAGGSCPSAPCETTNSGLLSANALHDLQSKQRNVSNPSPLGTRNGRNSPHMNGQSPNLSRHNVMGRNNNLTTTSQIRSKIGEASAIASANPGDWNEVHNGALPTLDTDMLIQHTANMLQAQSLGEHAALNARDYNQFHANELSDWPDNGMDNNNSLTVPICASNRGQDMPPEKCGYAWKTLPKLQESLRMAQMQSRMVYQQMNGNRQTPIAQSEGCQSVPHSAHALSQPESMETINMDLLSADDNSQSALYLGENDQSYANTPFFRGGKTPKLSVEQYLIRYTFPMAREYNNAVLKFCADHNLVVKLLGYQGRRVELLERHYRCRIQTSAQSASFPGYPNGRCVLFSGNLAMVLRACADLYAIVDTSRPGLRFNIDGYRVCMIFPGEYVGRLLRNNCAGLHALQNAAGKSVHIALGNLCLAMKNRYTERVVLIDGSVDAVCRVLELAAVQLQEYFKKSSNCACDQCIPSHNGTVSTATSTTSAATSISHESNSALDSPSKNDQREIHPLDTKVQKMINASQNTQCCHQLISRYEFLDYPKRIEVKLP